MTLPSITPNNQCDDDSDMFGPPRTSPPIGYHHHRSRVPMISPKLRQREERKRILQLCAHKLERIKDSETNLRRSVCINNTYCRLTDELRREKQSRYLANLPRTENKPESARDNIFNPYNSCSLDQPSNKIQQNENSSQHNSMQKNENSFALSLSLTPTSGNSSSSSSSSSTSPLANISQQQQQHSSNSSSSHHSADTTTIGNLQENNALNSHYTPSQNASAAAANNSANPNHHQSQPRKRCLSSSNIDKDLEILDRELSAINSPMPMIDPEITQGAEQLEKALSSRKRQRSEDESDRLVREALTQFYIPPQRLISAIDDCPLDMVNVGSLSPKRPKTSNDLDLEFDMNQNQKDIYDIMDALRLGSPSPTPSVGSDSCGQAAMMSESANVFHNLVVTSLET
uniref:SERTA motif protein n=1 Tax=Musca domestica TaxID=7370 RepID=T1PHL7_MUSDO